MDINLEGVLAGDKRSIARAISIMERGGEPARRALAALFPHTGRGHIIGITGAPGTGKSTLVCRLAAELRHRYDFRVGIVAVDPTSPFTGGALLGDRVRMQELACDPKVFIRSMGTRGSLGGLAESTADAVAVLDAAGYNHILVETVGTGQAEIDIAREAHTVIVVVMPGMGDDIQAAKAGILEIADILVVNKADRDMAERTVAEFALMLRLGAAPTDWAIPILRTVASRGTGIGALADAVERHHRHLQETGGWAERQRRHARQRLLDAARRQAGVLLERRVGRGRLADLVEQVASRRTDPYRAASELLAAAGLAEATG